MHRYIPAGAHMRANFTLRHTLVVHLVIVDSPKLPMLIHEVVLLVPVALGGEQVKYCCQLDLCVVEFVLEQVQHYVGVHVGFATLLHVHKSLCVSVPVSPCVRLCVCVCVSILCLHVCMHARICGTTHGRIHSEPVCV